MVRDRFADHPGSADFGMPVTRRDARAFLRDFLEHRLASFGPCVEQRRDGPERGSLAGGDHEQLPGGGGLGSAEHGRGHEPCPASW